MQWPVTIACSLANIIIIVTCNYSRHRLDINAYLADGLAIARHGVVNELGDGHLTITARHHQTDRVETNGHFHLGCGRWRPSTCRRAIYRHSREMPPRYANIISTYQKCYAASTLAPSVYVISTWILRHADVCCDRLQILKASAADFSRFAAAKKRSRDYGLRQR